VAFERHLADGRLTSARRQRRPESRSGEAVWASCTEPVSSPSIATWRTAFQRAACEQRALLVLRHVGADAEQLEHA
jgi:hypothetical protein